MSKFRIRSNEGSALAEFPVALGIVLVCLILIIFLLVGTTAVWLYKIKLGYISASAASAAVAGRYWMGSENPRYLQSSSNNYDSSTAVAAVQADCAHTGSSLGLPVQPAVTVSNTAVSVNVNAVNVPILPGSGVLPDSISLSDTGYQGYIKDLPIAWYGLSFTKYPYQPIRNSEGAFLITYGDAVNGWVPPLPATSPRWAVTGHGIGSVLVTAASPPVGGPLQGGARGGPFSHY